MTEPGATPEDGDTDDGETNHGETNHRGTGPGDKGPGDTGPEDTKDRTADDGGTDDVDAIAEAWRRERPGTPVDSIGVITRIWRIGKLLRDDRRRTLARLGIDEATLDLLATLRRAGPPYRMPAGRIARDSLVSAGAVTQRVDRAQRAGLVTRTHLGQPDRRRVEVSLTAHGHALLDRTVDDLLRHEETHLAALRPDERHRLAALLRTLLAGLTSAGQRPGPNAGRRPGSGQTGSG